MTTNLAGQPRHTVNLSDPIWLIEHLAQAFHITVDRARRHTYREGFPRPKQGFETHAWCREAVLEWFRTLPEVPPTPAMTRRASQPSTPARGATSASVATARPNATAPPGRAAGPRTTSTYKPRPRQRRTP